MKGGIFIIIDIDYFYPIEIEDITDFDLDIIASLNKGILIYYCAYDNSGFYVLDLYNYYDKLVKEQYKKVLVFTERELKVNTFYMIAKKDLYRDSKLISKEHGFIIKELHNYAGYVSICEGIMVPKGLENIYDKIKINNE